MIKVMIFMIKKNKHGFGVLKKSFYYNIKPTPHYVKNKQEVDCITKLFIGSLS